MCAKDDLIRRKGLLSISTQTQLAGELATAESVTAKEYNILLLIAFIISYRLFADKLASFCHVSLSTTILACTVEYYCLLSNTALENAAKSGILLACADRRIRQCYLTICAILADYEEQVLLTGVKKNRYCTRCTKHYNFNIHVSLATDILHLLLKGLVIKMLDFMQDMLDNIYSSSRKTWDNSTTLVTQESSSTYIEQKAIIQQLIAVVSPLFVLKAPFALHFIRATYAYCTYSTRVTRSLPFCRLRWLIPGIQPYLIKLPLSEVAANIAISNFIHAAAVKRHNDPKHCDEKVLYLILIIIDYTCYDKDGKHIAYIGAFSKVLLFNNNEQIDNTTRMLTFKFYDLSTIIRLVHLVLRDLPNLTTHTTMSYYVNNYIN
ncbi:hypothetical protein HBH61_119680 [Parastagonospora nodorum]|nr:hypothetical protein HBH61_119680 [Parastagonospora nodorum]